MTLIGLALLATLGCSSAGGSASAPGDPGAPADPFQRGEFQRELLLTGELEAVRSIGIKAPQTNTFQMRIQFMAEEGKVIKQGDPLLDFDNSALVEQVRDLESQILDAEIQIVTRENELASDLKDLEIQLAEREFEFKSATLEASVDAVVLSRKEYGERQLALTKATEELEAWKERILLVGRRGTADVDVLTINRDKLKKDLVSARDSVELLSIKAPAEGLVVYEKRDGTTLRYQEGDSCWPGQGVMRLPDLSEMQVSFSVNEVDAPRLAVGMTLQISLDAFPGKELEGEIINIPSMAVKRDESSRVAVFKVSVRLSETWVGEMKPGMSALGRVVVESLPGVPLIAREAVQFDGETYWFETTRPDGSPGSRTAIEPVARNERFYVLSEQEYARLTGESDRADQGVVHAGVGS